MEYTKEQIIKLEAQIDRVDPRKTSWIVCSAGIIKCLTQTTKFKEGKIENLGKCLIFVGTYGQFSVFINKALDEDDLRLFNEDGEVFLNLVLEGFVPQDFFV